MPFWPFKRKSLPQIEESPHPKLYSRGDEDTAESLADKSHTDAANYKAAMQLFGESQPEQVEWIHHTDGYWYQKNSDGSFNPVAHILDAEGNKIPFNEQDQ